MSINANNLVFKSFCWCLGTTSFRTKNFNKKIEEQLHLLDSFWRLPKNEGKTWSNNSELQVRYYETLKQNGFVEGSAQRKDKDARQKTSGLVNIGLIDSNRRLTDAGARLLNISKKGDFSSDNALRIAGDSFIYLKQLLKSHVEVEEYIVRPFIVLIFFLSKLEYLSADEFTFLLPLCINRESTQEMLEHIINIRQKKLTVDDVIVMTLLQKKNYQDALSALMSNEVSEDLICKVGLNRKSRSYDSHYAKLYRALFEVFYQKNTGKIKELIEAIKELKLGKWWHSYLFDTTNNLQILKNPLQHISPNAFQTVKTECEFKKVFFETMHLFKAKATLSDYFDLNRRYVKTTDIILFDDDRICFDVVPKQIFKPAADSLFMHAFSKCDLLETNCTLEDISLSLRYNESQIITSLNEELGQKISTIDDAYLVVERKRYERFNAMVDRVFTDEILVELLSHFDERKDKEINKIVTDNADVPTIFEYILAIIWYKVSGKQGKILDYMKLSLDADFLPISHAAGGESDIVYEYAESQNFPTHCLLLEATLADGTNQRRMEMEPVSRHLGNHLLKTKNHASYCVFVTNNLNVNVISDFRNRKTMIYCNPQNPAEFVQGMKIIPLQTSDLKSIIMQHTSYDILYQHFEKAHQSTEFMPLAWYENFVKQREAQRT